jgi:microcystin-dependent protein
MPTGMIISFAGSSAPDGWLMCNGDEVSKTTYPRLFSVIGSIYGSANDSNNFVLPDLRSRNIVGASSGDYALAEKHGSENVTLSISNLPSHSHTGTTDASGNHSHTATDSGHQHGYEDAFFAEAGSGYGTNYAGTRAGVDFDNGLYTRNMTSNTSYANVTLDANGSHSHTFTTSSVGSATSFSVVQPYIAINYLIKYI